MINRISPIFTPILKIPEINPKHPFKSCKSLSAERQADSMPPALQLLEKEKKERSAREAKPNVW